jgi:peptidoglycan/LPS O-acetylase OafA/YrhL
MIRDRDNNFDTMRLIAAITVLISHSLILSYGPEQIGPQLSEIQVTTAQVAVAAFFAISGYLITGSYLRSRDPVKFVTARALRLMPALVVVILLLAFVIGPALSELPRSEYFASWNVYRFAAMNILMVNAEVRLPGVFLQNPLRAWVDGSLWTLSYEVGCYFLVLCLGMVGRLNRLWLTVLYLCCLFASVRLDRPECYLTATFLGGAVICVWRPAMRPRCALVCAILWLVSILTAGETIASCTVGAYTVLYLSTSPKVRLPNLARWGDLSYGTYIWAFPVQQTIAYILGAAVTWYWMMAAALPIVILLALASWHLVESPCLVLLRRSSPPRQSVLLRLGRMQETSAR